MKEEGVVLAVQGGLAQVESVISDACASCGAKNACHAMGGDKKRVVSALNQAGAQVGDRVLLSVPAKAVLSAGFLVYIVPILALMAGAGAGQRWGPAWGWDGQTGAVVMGLAALAVCWYFLRLVSRKMGRSREMAVKVVRVIRRGESHAVDQHSTGL